MLIGQALFLYLFELDDVNDVIMMFLLADFTEFKAYYLRMFPVIVIF